MKILAPESLVNTNDRAFNYGDGVFTTMLVKRGNVQLLSLHVRRVVNDAARLGISLSSELLYEAITSKANTLSEDRTVLKVHVSAGEGGRGYSRCPEASPLVRFSSSSYPSHYDELKMLGMSLICANIALALQPALAGIKHLNRLEQILVKNEISAAQLILKQDIHDAVVCDTQGNIVESSVGNLYWRKGQKWYTPKLDQSGVNGVVRQVLLEYFALSGIDVEEVTLPLNSLSDASAVIVTNALMGVMPVSQVVDQEWFFESSVSTAQMLNETLEVFMVELQNKEAII